MSQTSILWTFTASLVLCIGTVAGASGPSEDQTNQLPLASLINAQELGEQMIAVFPSAPIRQDISGAVKVQVKVTPDGRAIECQVVESSGSMIIDRWACRGTERYARFEPGTDAEGHAIESRWSSTMSFNAGPSGSETITAAP
ncbi:MAG: TonB family protein [Pseudomonadota bacterium]